ncbi:hypothetical protein [Psychroserpens mesophilus]|uniref:hypothetical protein n=1 Tax=Psychroserpens mesophilus TaxID=325473 RepID=UPI003D64D5DB
MVLNSIEKLLEKYDNGETSLKEEQQLKAYFAQDNVAPHLESYRVMFQYFKTTKQELYTKDVPLKPKRNNVYQWISVAAVAVLMLGILIPNILGGNDNLTLADLSDEERKMYYQTKEALAMLGSNFDKGTSSFNALSLASESFNVGAKKASHVNKLATTTNKLLKNENK